MPTVLTSVADTAACGVAKLTHTTNAATIIGGYIAPLPTSTNDDDAAANVNAPRHSARNHHFWCSR